MYPTTKILLTLALLALPGTQVSAATMDGALNNLNEYSFNTLAVPNPKHNTHNHGSAGSEADDGSGGDKWDINYLGTDIDRSGATSMFQFGAVGGNILSGQNSQSSQDLFLSDLALSVRAPGSPPVEDPTINDTGSTGWNYAIRLLGLVDSKDLKDNQKQADFEVFEFVDGSSWEGRNIYNRNPDGSQGHVTRTFEMMDGQSKGTFSGIYTDNGGDNNVLEGAFRLSLLSLFDEATGGSIISYLTMSCVNDEAIVYADIAAVPVPAAFWLFGTALLGFIGISRRTAV